MSSNVHFECVKLAMWNHYMREKVRVSVAKPWAQICWLGRARHIRSVRVRNPLDSLWAIMWYIMAWHCWGEIHRQEMLYQPTGPTRSTWTELEDAVTRFNGGSCRQKKKKDVVLTTSFLHWMYANEVGGSDKIQ